jgi:hypothetical protein
VQQNKGRGSDPAWQMLLALQEHSGDAEVRANGRYCCGADGTRSSQHNPVTK